MSGITTSERDDPKRRLVTIAVLVAVVVAGIGAAAMSATPDGRDGRDQPGARPVNATAQLAALHDAGVTGANVSVGVVGVTGFDVDHPALAGRVAAARSFAPGETVWNGGRNDHGTAAASLVARTAPDADLYLASFDTAPGFRDAVTWLVAEDVDVIVAPVSFYGKPGDGSAFASRVAARAARRDVVFVAPAGNLGRGHWQGAFSPTADGIHRFAGGTRNYLADGARRLTLWLSWPRRHARHDFTLALYRARGDGARLVARSQPYPGDGVPNERVVARVAPDGTYFFVVEGPANASGVHLEVSSPTHALQYRERAGSVTAPAGARRVVSVGAYDTRANRVEPFSAAGPADGNRPGVDVVAPDRLYAPSKQTGLVGSSAAAPYVAGVAALALDAGGDLPPGRVEAILEATADDLGRPGVDPVSGHGLVAPRRAVNLARNATKNGL